MKLEGEANAFVLSFYVENFVSLLLGYKLLRFTRA